VKQQSAPDFLLQPHQLYPMTQEEFDHWLGILRTHFPRHRLLASAGTTFRPFLPEEFAAKRAEHEAAHPVCEMRDQDGARRVDPCFDHVVDWVDMMNDGDLLMLQRRDGGALKWRRHGPSFVGECCEAPGGVHAHASGIVLEVVHRVSGDYLRGDALACIKHLRMTAATNPVL